MPQTDRRSFLIAAGITLCAVNVPRSLGQSDGAKKKSIIRSGHPLFSTVLQQHFSGAEQLSSSPFAILITNNSKWAARSYTISWKYVSTTRGVVHFTRTFEYGPTKAIPRIRYTGRRVLLKSGETALVTPSGFLSASRYDKLGNRAFSLPKGALESQSQGFMAGLGPGVPVYSSLEAKLGSATAWGRAPSSEALLFYARRAAERDEAIEISTLLTKDPNLDVASAVAVVQQSVKVPNAMGALSFSYLSHRKHFAAIIARRATELSRMQLLSLLARGIALQNTKLSVQEAVQKYPWGYLAPASVIT